jgi:hypothetical protein
MSPKKREVINYSIGGVHRVRRGSTFCVRNPDGLSSVAYRLHSREVGFQTKHQVESWRKK